MVITPSAVPDGFTPYTQPYLCGTPASVIERIRELHQAEIGRLDVSFSGLGLPLASGRRDMELFAAEVLPAVHASSDDVVPA